MSGDGGSDGGSESDVDGDGDTHAIADARPGAADLGDADADALVDTLLAADVLTEHEDGTLATTEDFEGTRGIYYDTYGNASDTVFRESVASAFDLTASEAEQRIEEEGVTREMFVDYLSVNSHVEGEHSRVDLARMAMLVGEVAPDTPVPEGMDELDDDSYGAFLADHGRAAVFVWKRNCSPCDRLKRDLDGIIGALPEDVAVAGVDGEGVSAFRRDFDVQAAPSILLLADGELRETLRGYVQPEAVAAATERAYGSD